MEEVVELINELRPKYVFVTATNGAGKTYFSNQLDGYKVLELDGVVESTGEAFGIKWPEQFKMYKNSLPAPVMDAFAANIHSFFQQHLDSPIVVEGAIADAELIKKPVDVDVYAERMMKLFKYEKENGIRILSICPQVIPELEEAEYESEELKQFMIRMAHESMIMSAQRYDYLETNGLGMIRVEV